MLKHQQQQTNKHTKKKETNGEKLIKITKLSVRNNLLLALEASRFQMK